MFCAYEYPYIYRCVLIVVANHFPDFVSKEMGDPKVGWLGDTFAALFVGDIEG